MRPRRRATQTAFRLENQMTPPVIGWLTAEGLTVKSEFSIPWGVCDLVGVKFSRSRVRLRLRYGQKHSVGPPLRLHILSKIPDHRTGRAITLVGLRRECLEYLPDELLERELSFLQHRKFITSPRRGQFQKLNGWAPLHLRIVAVELKLSRSPKL